MISYNVRKWGLLVVLLVIFIGLTLLMFRTTLRYYYGLVSMTNWALILFISSTCGLFTVRLVLKDLKTFFLKGVK